MPYYSFIINNILIGGTPCVDMKEGWHIFLCDYDLVASWILQFIAFKLLFKTNGQTTNFMGNVIKSEMILFW